MASSRCWLRSKQHGWLPAVSEDGIVHVDPTCASHRAGPLPDDVPVDQATMKVRALQDTHQSVSDMTELGEVSEAAMLHNIYLRYCTDSANIYTFVGGVLASLNPYRPMPDLYGPQQMAAYRQGKADAHVQDAMSEGETQTAVVSERTRAEPHLYAVVEAAYSELLATSRDQALVMSGESGAGKTEACKLAMAYLAAASAASSSAGGAADEVAQRVSRCMLESNVVLEALGNAKTYRNDNSSRFGKWVALHVSIGGQICGGRLTTYLLESVRVTRQMAGERNYHVFYQLIAAAQAGELHRHMGPENAGLVSQWLLSSPRQYAYLRESDCDAVPVADDVAGFAALCSGLNTVRVDAKGQCDLFRLLSALLVIGNIRFEPYEDQVKGIEGCRIIHAAAGFPSAPTATSLEVAARLLKVSPHALEATLTKRRVVLKQQEEAVWIPLRVPEAEDARDAVASSVYGGLFAWVVQRVNLAASDAIEDRANVVSDDEDEDEDEDEEGEGRTPAVADADFALSEYGGTEGNAQARSADEELPRKRVVRPMRGITRRISMTGSSSIGILDVFGFEDLKTNSFEQLCINYTNEKLQAYFTAFMFKQAQDEYQAEGISVAAVSYTNNDAQVALVDGRPMGLLALLESECFIPRGSDIGFLEKLDDAFGGGKNPFFDRPKVRSKDREDAFTIRHYAGDVVYRCAGWLEKARGVVRGDLQSLLRESECALLTSLPGLNQSAESESPQPGSAVTTSVSEPEPSDKKEEEVVEEEGGLGALLKSLGEAVGIAIDVGGSGNAPSAEPASKSRAVEAAHRGGTKRSTVGTRFAAELASLVRLLSAVSARFIRCLKPNMLKAPDVFDGGSVLRQLRYTGMLECIHILRVGFPVSLKYDEVTRLLQPLAARLPTKALASHPMPNAEAQARASEQSCASTQSCASAHSVASRSDQSSVQSVAGPVSVDGAPRRDSVHAPRRDSVHAPRRDSALGAEPRWLAQLLEHESTAARDELPVDSVERDAASWALGKTKLFLRGFLFAHLNRRREVVRDLATRRLQHRHRHRMGLRTSARQQLLLLMKEGTVEQLMRVLPRAKAAGAPKELVRQADAVVIALTTGARLRCEIEAFMDSRDIKGLGSAVAESMRWLRVNASDERALSWAQVESARVALRAWQSAALVQTLQSAVEQQSLDLLHEALGAARKWLKDVDSEGPREADKVAEAVSGADVLLAQLMTRASAAQEVVAILARGTTADPDELAAAIECAEQHEVDGSLLDKARELQADLAAAAAERKQQEERRKREAEAAAERQRRVARQSAIETRRLSVKAENDKQKSVMRARETEEDAALLAAAGGMAMALQESSSGPSLRTRATSKSQEARGSITSGFKDRGSFATNHSSLGEMTIPNIPESVLEEDPSRTTEPQQSRGDQEGVEKSGWLLKTGPPSKWKPPSWSQRFFVLVGGTLYYYRPQELDSPAGRIDLGSACSVSDSVTLRSPPAGAFTITVPAHEGGADQPDGTPNVRIAARTYRMSAGSADEMKRWTGAIRAALGQPSRASPPVSSLENMATLTGSVTAAGGSSFAVRIQKHLATQQASEEDLSSLLGRDPGLLPAVRAVLAAYGHVVGDENRAELSRRCFVLAAKTGVLLRCRLLNPDALAPAEEALRQAFEHVRDKEQIVRPKDRGSARLLPGAVAVDSSDPFHVEMASSIRSVGSALGASLGPHMSEATLLQLQDVFAAISGQDILTSLFGNALRPAAGIACVGALQELMRAAAMWLEQHTSSDN